MILPILHIDGFLRSKNKMRNESESEGRANVESIITAPQLKKKYKITNDTTQVKITPHIWSKFWVY